MDHDEVEGVALHRGRIDVALPQDRAAHARALQIGARHHQHGVVVDAHDALGPGREQRQHPAGAGAQVQQRPDRARPDGVDIAVSTWSSETCSERILSHSTACRLK